MVDSQPANENNENPMIENENIKIWIEGDIMCSEYKIETVRAENARSMIQTRLLLCNGKTYPFFADVTKVKSIDKEARDEFSHGSGIELMSACALLINSPLNRILGNFFMSVNRPNVPTRLFTSSTEALEWLKKFK